MKEQYDVVVVGSGPGGYVAALRCAQNGFSTLCVDKRSAIGGTCLNVGCIPSKALLHSSERYAFCQEASEELGVEVKELQLDFAKMMQRKSAIVDSLRQGVTALVKGRGVDFESATASFIDLHTLQITSDQGQKQTVKAENIILATGSAPIELPFAPFDEKKIVSSTGALSLDRVPKQMIVIGAGIIGVELASVYRRLGAKQQIIEMADHICPGIDKDLAKMLYQSLTKQGLQFTLGTKVEGVELQDSQVIVSARLRDGSLLRSACDLLLVCVGRRPYTQGLQLEQAGLQVDEQGFLPVDGRFKTAQPHIFAIGDLIRGQGLAHRASEEGISVADQLAGREIVVNYTAVPNVVYTTPEVASVGLTQEQAASYGLELLVGKAYFRGNPRARCSSEAEGMVKLLAEKKSRQLLGLHILGPHASELIAQGALAMAMGCTLSHLANTPCAHPTLSEAIKEAALDALGTPLH